MQVLFRRAKPFLAVVFLQVGLAGMDIVSKAALNEGMSNYVFVVYRHAVAFLVIAPFALILDKKIRPRMTLSTFGKLMLMSLLEPVIDQNLYFLGMKYTTATFAAAMANVLPAITFLMAFFFRLEKVQLMRIRSQAKIVGTIATVVGAMIMTMLRGPDIGLPWTNGRSSHEHQHNGVTLKHSIKGSIMITIGCFSWACFMILQAFTLQTYPAELSLTAWICFLGTIEGGIVALAVERGNTAVWSISWDMKLLAAVYSGIFCSGIAYYIQGVVMKERGPVFVSAFSPLSMVIVAVLSSFILAEKMYLGRVLGAIVIVAGLYFVVWGKKYDHKSPTIKEQEIPVKQNAYIAEDGTINGHSNCEVTIDHVPKQGVVAGDERLNNRN
ncbi:WAT1-related protein [Abeliophyllum distichum]|uniref:WAT1-related protein n=1 Tax=Abeliophyllum distichum TaxID=126358 RepID=A0ABD1QZ92_9LAMI